MIDAIWFMIFGILIYRWYITPKPTKTEANTHKPKTRIDLHKERKGIIRLWSIIKYEFIGVEK